MIKFLTVWFLCSVILATHEKLHAEKPSSITWWTWCVAAGVSCFIGLGSGLVLMKLCG